MSIVKLGNGYGYGGYSRPQVNYHQQNSEYVTTVIKEMSRMTVNQKPGYGVGDVQKNKVCKEGQMVEEKNCGYNGYHGGDAVQKHEYKQEASFEEKKSSGYNNGGYKHEAAFEEKGSSYNGYHGGGGAVQKQGYKQEVFEAANADSYSGYHGGGGGGAVKQKHEYHHQEGAFDGACDDGYSLHHGASAAVKNKHGYQHGGAGYAASHHGGGDMHKYGYQKEAYGKADAGGSYGYGGHYKQQAAYGGGAITGAVQQHAYYQDAYDQADAAGYGGGAMQAYDAGYKQKKAGYGGGAMQKHGYKQETMYGKTAGGYHGGAYNNDYNMAHGHAAKTEFAGGHHHSHGAAYESESDCEENDYESDCEDAAFGHPNGGVRRYEAYERHENLGGGHRYESYQTATHEGYTAGGAGYGACAPPRKNRFFF